MDHFMQHAASGLYVSSLLWNVAHCFDFKDFDERHKKFSEEFDRTRRRFDTMRVVVPVVMGLLFVVFFIIFCCIAYRRRQRFWEMQQQQQRHVPPPLAATPGPGPVTSGATNYSYSGGNSFMPTGVTPPTAPYPPQPFQAYSGGWPNTSLNCAPSAQPFSGTATPWPCAPPPPPYSSETKQPV